LRGSYGFGHISIIYLTEIQAIKFIINLDVLNLNKKHENPKLSPRQR
jgi:hypothetical protein